MFVPSKSVPKIGEIRYGKVDGKSNVHRYVGVHPYLVVSNDTYNKFSGQSEVIPFTTKRPFKTSPAHAFYKYGEVEGIKSDSTLIVESRDIIPNNQLSEPVGKFTDANWKKAVKCMVKQCPYLKVGFEKQNQTRGA